MNELVSIIVPAYNVEKYIVRCLNSIKNQSYKNIEVIIINDGSTDHTLHVINEFVKNDKRFKVFSQDNSGLSSARNNGINQAKGKYITFVDSDDWIHFDYVKLMAELADRFHSDIISCNYLSCDSYIPMKQEKIKYKKYTKQCADALFSCKDTNYAWGKLIRANIMRRRHIYFPEGRVYEDIGTMYKIYDQCDDLIIVKNKLYYYFCRNGSITSNRRLADVRDKLFFVDEMNCCHLRQKYACWEIYRLIKLFGAMADLYKISDIGNVELKKYKDEIYSRSNQIKIPIKGLLMIKPQNVLRVLLIKTHMASVFLSYKYKFK